MIANGFTWAYQIMSKSQAYEALSLFHQREGVPNIKVMDSSKEQLLGKFATDADKLDCVSSKLCPTLHGQMLQKGQYVS